VTYTKEEEVELAEQKKYYAARSVWLRQNKLTPISRQTWKQWWEKMFKDDYLKYTKKMIKKKRA
tara:strand:- start:3774 stop:3965 length:192 start_codon:yes stop_codon:yes gene_type:complete